MSLPEVQVAAQKADDEGSLSFIVMMKRGGPLSNKETKSGQDEMKRMDGSETLIV